MKKLFLAVMTVCILSSCNNYYRAALAPAPTDPGTFENVKMKGKYLILRNGSQAFAMKDVSLSPDKKDLQCTLGSLPFDHQLHLHKGRDGKMRYAKNNEANESAVLNEVHIYINTNEPIAEGLYTLPLNMIQKTEVLEQDKARTKRSQAVGLGIGITAAVAGVVGLVALAADTVVSSLF